MAPLLFSSSNVSHLVLVLSHPISFHYASRHLLPSLTFVIQSPVLMYHGTLRVRHHAAYARILPYYGGLPLRLGPHRPHQRREGKGKTKTVPYFCVHVTEREEDTLADGGDDVDWSGAEIGGGGKRGDDEEEDHEADTDSEKAREGKSDERERKSSAPSPTSASTSRGMRRGSGWGGAGRGRGRGHGRDGARRGDAARVGTKRKRGDVEGEDHEACGGDVHGQVLCGRCERAGEGETDKRERQSLAASASASTSCRTDREGGRGRGRGSAGRSGGVWRCRRGGS
ncbi:hypothetical protein B0H12DRAFT_125909 [Mycena haematopus]|nr:hypothetical protein B0H12DRAFT_125909 [Mycena haematopus]